MKEVWAKDYADNYLDHYSFRYIMGPFNMLPGDLVEELTWILCTRKQMSRAALHLMLVPQLRSLSLERCPGLLTSALCAHIAARCQGLRSLDLSGGQQLSSKVLSETLGCLPALRSLSLAGTPCDSLLALDIGFREQEGDSLAVAAYLLLSLPSLERVALEDLAQACCLIQHRQFNQTDEFTDREGVPRLGEVWRQWGLGRGMDKKKREGATAGEKEEGGNVLLDGYGSESDEDAARDEGPHCSQNQTEDIKKGRSLSCDDRLFLRLKDVKVLSCDSLDSLSNACPNMYSISVNVDPFGNARGSSQGSLLAAGLQSWAGQLRRLSVHYPGPLADLLPALRVAGSSLVSLTLEGVKTSPHTPLLELIKLCPRLRDLLISAEPPTAPQGAEDEEDQGGDPDPPQLPDLCSLTLNFSYEHSQMKPVMSWMSLRRVLKCLLAGSPLLEKLSLVSLPCPLNCVLKDVLHVLDLDQNLFASSTNSPSMPLGRIQSIDLPRTDVKMITVRSLMQRSKRLNRVDLSYCWRITQLEWLNCETSSKVQVVWL
ncbi:hypothetical protein EYF80_015533 [Liparis tanakae]|uniref:Uncharacterized protein n=1 Tax=Liparis tanakae TaxID=230148 RepID=A0A4Z2I8U3_9TELE|nr:hypothetical protein EYF80_015533 [Liparis tanakae]